MKLLKGANCRPHPFGFIPILPDHLLHLQNLRCCSWVCVCSTGSASNQLVVGGAVAYKGTTFDFLADNRGLAEGARVSLPGRLFGCYSKMLSLKPLEGKRVALSTAADRDFRSVIELSRAAASDVVVFESLAVLVGQVRARPWMWGVVVVDLDAEDIGKALDALCDLRVACPQQVVVIASREFRSSDTSGERLPVADASMRIPIEYSSFEKVLVAAEENNRHWRERTGQSMTRQAGRQSAEIVPISNLFTSAGEEVQRSVELVHPLGDLSMPDAAYTGVQLEQHPRGELSDAQHDWRFPPGWWILPSAVLGVLMWVGLFWSLLRVLGAA
jgi:hypothetical protein